MFKARRTSEPPGLIQSVFKPPQDGARFVVPWLGSLYPARHGTASAV